MDWSAFGERLRSLVGIKPRNDVVSNLSFDDFRRMFILGDGDDISPQTALQAIPVQACFALIAGGITSMPLRIVRREVVNGVMTQTPADSHDYWWLFNEQPNDDCTSALFWEEIVKRKVLWGRAFARIVRPNVASNKIRELVFVPNENVQVECAWDPVRRRDVITRYLVRDGKNTFGVLPADMLDFRGRATVGYPTMSDALYSARQAVAMVLTIEQYCAKFFANGGMPRMVLSFPSGVKLNAEQQQLLREAYVRRLGGADNAAVPFVLTDGGDAKKLSFTAEEAQMLDARKFQVIEIARAFGVPPFMIGETEKTSAWGTGIEQMSQGFIRYTLGPHITAIEQELNRKLFGIDRFFVDFDEEALSRGDMKSLGDWFRQAVGGNNGPGFMTVNEVRSRLKLPPVDGGTDIYVPAGGSNAQGTEPAASPAGSEPGQAATV
jgi:HK97 family phage portal protein